MSKPNFHTICVAILLLLGVALRFSGLTRGISGFVLPLQADAALQSSFYQFHPDEEMLVRAALEPIDPLVPPYTVYGLLPNYALRGALLAFGWANLDLAVEEDASRIYVLARFLAAALSCGTLICTWALGRRYCTRWTALFGLTVVAFSPGAVQQAHFYIADGFFSLVSLVAMWAILRTVETRERRWYLLSGLLIGALGTVRLNGLTLGLVLMIGHITQEVNWLHRLRKLLAGNLWISGAVASTFFIVLNPFVLFNPNVFSKDGGREDFATAINWAFNQTLQPWTLKDVNTLLFWDHWFDLWPLIATWPLTLAFTAAIFHVILKRQPWSLLVLAWCAIYFIPIGSMPVKAIRYLVPLLPFMALFTGMLCTAVSGRYRRITQGAVLFLVGHIALSGLAFSRIYTNEDSRIQAGRWISDNIAVGSRIGLENGAFSMKGMIDSQRHPHTWINTSRLFYLQPYQLCSNQIDYLHRKLSDSEYLVIIDANRAAQFRAVPELFPVIAAFYARLIDGQLGFDLIKRFKVYPELASVKIIDDKAVPDFLGYDHPAVMVFRRSDVTDTEKAFVDWKRNIRLNTHCPDRGLEKNAATLLDGRIHEARIESKKMAHRHTNTQLLKLLEVKAFRMLGRNSEARTTMEHVWPQNVTGLMSHVNNPHTFHLVPASLAQSAATLGLTELAVDLLNDGVKRNKAASLKLPKEMAESYRTVANYMRVNGQAEAFEHSLSLSMRIHPHQTGLNILAMQALQRGASQSAVSLYRQSLEIDPSQARVHASLGAVLLQDGKLSATKALLHLQTAIELDPGLETRLQPLLIQALRIATEKAL